MSGTLELEALVAMGRAAKAAGASDMEHLDGPAAAYNYVRISDLVASHCRGNPKQQPVLDWGCGYGQVSWLLQNRGLEVVSFDIEKRPLKDVIPNLAAVPISYGEHAIRLPYPSRSFGSVLSVGVLEHVSDFEGSLSEIARVLRPDGLLFIFMLPNQYSWAEWISDRRGTSAHPYKFTFGSTIKLLSRHGFELRRTWRRHVLPRNLTGMSSRVKHLYGKFYRSIESADRVLTQFPPVCYMSGVIEMIAVKAEN